MAKILNGGALISYGPTLPTVGQASDGALFYKTDSAIGGSSGLYLFGFIKDSNPGQFGSQVQQGWTSAVSPDLYLSTGGGVLTGPLTVPDVLRVTKNTGVQRILIGNQNGGALPVVLEGLNGNLNIGQGTNWSTGGTLTPGLGISVQSLDAGLTWLGQQVWHAGNDGAGSTLDADLLDGQQGAFYQNASNMATGTLAVTRGGTGSTSTIAGGVAYGASTSQIGTTAAGVALQVLLSGGAAAPTWASQSALSVGFATNASTANNANNATNAINATNASNVPWTGVSGRPTLFYDFGDAGTASPAPTTFPAYSISGFDSYFTSDIGQYQVGLTLMGQSAPAGARGLQIAANWNLEETAARGLRFRVNDDSGTVGSWGAWGTLWDNQNLTEVGQLGNAVGYVSATVANANYVRRDGSTMSGNLVINGITFTHATSAISTAGAIYATGQITSGGGAIVSNTGNVQGVNTVATNAAYGQYLIAQSGANSGNWNADNGALRVAGGASMTGNIYAGGAITAQGNVTAFSDRRAKKDITPIEDAIAKVMKLTGVNFTRIHDGIRGTGLIAQDVIAVAPEAVETHEEGYLSVAYGNLVGLLVEAVKAQQAQIDELKAGMCKCGA
jgi:hypothetical protein